VLVAGVQEGWSKAVEPAGNSPWKTVVRDMEGLSSLHSFAEICFLFPDFIRMSFIFHIFCLLLNKPNPLATGPAWCFKSKFLRGSR
jgi:hypothetical protein